MAEDEKKKPEDESQELLVPETPAEITPENAHLVDFENLKVRLICLVSIPNAFTQVSNFLKRRGWEVFVTTEIKDALTQASTFKPDFILMSVNHPHKKINQFPQIVVQTFNVPVIAFGEKTDAKTMSAIQVSRAQYKVMGHLSGPTAQRKIKQLLQDKYQVEESKEGNRAFENMGSERDEVRISSAQTGMQKGPLKFSGKKTTKPGALIFEKNQSSMSKATGMGYNPLADGKQQKPGTQDKPGAAYQPKEQDPGNETPTAELSTAAKIQKDKEEMAKALKELGSQIGSGNLDTEESHSIQQSGVENKSQGSATSGSVENKSVGTETESGPEQNIHSVKEEGYTMESEYVPKKEKKAPVLESEYVGRKNETRSHLRDVDQRSFIEKATVEIVQLMRSEEHENSPGLRMVSRVALLSIGHDHHKGYFMIAGHDTGMNLDDFVEEFIDHFKKHCLEKNEPMEFGDYINMDCPDYDFFDNGEEGLEFNYVTSFGAGEIGVKFIHDEEAWAHVETKDNHEKALIKAEQVVEDKPLEIDLFVHLQRNQKYFKIVSSGSELSHDRKERLVEKETEVFINNNDIGNYRNFQTKQKAMREIEKTVKRKTKKKAS